MKQSSQHAPIRPQLLSLWAVLSLFACNEDASMPALTVQGDATGGDMTGTWTPDATIGNVNIGATGGLNSLTPMSVDASAPTCITAPDAWICDPCQFEDAVCDCDCGASDPACQVEDCKDIPATWTCDAGSYMDGVCSCECGAWDPDCDADPRTTDCSSGYCAQPGTCEPSCLLAAPALPTAGQFPAPDYSIEPGTGVVFFHNAGSLLINDLRVRQSGGIDWGVNQLGTETILPNNYYALRGIPCNVAFDIQTRVLMSTGATSGPTEQTAVTFVCDKRQVLLLP